MPKYKLQDGREYNIPEDKVQDFLSYQPDAQVVKDSSAPFYLQKDDKGITTEQKPLQQEETIQKPKNVFDIPDKVEPKIPDLMKDSGVNPYILEKKLAKPGEQIKTDLDRKQSNYDRAVITSYRNKYLNDNLDKIKSDPQAVSFLQQATTQEDLENRLNQLAEPNFKNSKDYYLMNAELESKGDPTEYFKKAFEAFRNNKELFKDSENDTSETKLNSIGKSIIDSTKSKQEVQNHIGGGVLAGANYPATHETYDKEMESDMKDFLANTEIGRNYANAEKEHLESLSNRIEPLLNKAETLRQTASKRGFETHNDVPGFPNVSAMRTTGNALLETSLMNKSINVLKESKRMLESSEMKNKLAQFGKGAKVTQEDLLQFATFTEFLNDARLNDVIDKYENDPESLTEEESLALEAKAVADQISAGVDPGSFFNIGKGAKDSASYMRDFILTAPIGGAFAGAAKGAVNKLAQKSGIDFLLSRGAGKTIDKAVKGLIDLTVRPSTQMLFQPSSYAMAFKDMQGQLSEEDGKIKAEGRKDFSLLGAYDENQSEVLGDVVLDGMFRRIGVPWMSKMPSKLSKALSKTTGIQGPLSEFIEEKYSESKNLLRGETTLEEFFDPRSNLETAGVVLAIQIPFAGIKTVSKTAGKIRERQQIKSINRAYEKTSTLLDEEVGDLSSNFKQFITDAVATGDENTIKQAIFQVVDNPTIPDNVKRAVTSHFVTEQAKQGLEQAKAENIQESEEKEQTGAQLYVRSQLQKKSNSLNWLQSKKGLYEQQLGELANITEDNIQDVIANDQITDEQLEIWNNYNAIRSTYNGVIQQVQSDIENYLAPQINTLKNVAREDGTIVEVDLAGDERNSHVVDGNIILDENGYVDRNKSDKVLVVVDSEGNRKQVSLDHVDNVKIDNLEESSNALRQSAYEKYLRPLANKLEGKAEYGVGDQVEYINPQSKVVAGQVVAKQGETVTIVNQEGKTETLTAQELSNNVIGPQMQVADLSLKGGETLQLAIDGQVFQGTVTDIADGKATINIENGPKGFEWKDWSAEELATAIAPPVQAEVQEQELSESNISEQEKAENATDPLEERQQNVSETAETVANSQNVELTPEQEQEQLIASLPRTKDGEIDYNKIEDDDAYITALKSEFPGSESEIIDEYKKQAEQLLKGANRIKDPIKKIRAQKQAQAKIDRFTNLYEKLNPRTQYEIRMSELEDGNTRQRESKMGEYLSLRDFLLRNIATGKFKFRWNSKGNNHGLGNEILAGKNTESERKKRISFLDNNGYSPETLAEYITENAGQGSDINPGWFSDMGEVRNEIIDILLTHDTPTSMIDSATELRKEPESIEEYAEQFIDPALVFDYEANETSQNEMLLSLPTPKQYNEISDEEIEAYYTDQISEEEYNNYINSITFEPNKTKNDTTDSDRGTRVVDNSTDAIQDTRAEEIADDTRGNSSITSSNEEQGASDIDAQRETEITAGPSAQESIEQPNQERTEQDARRPIEGSADSVEQDVAPLKQQQYDIIQASNPMQDDVHAGIRSAEDILTAEEAFSETINNEDDVAPDFMLEDAEKALKTGKITVYSSYPIQNGVFVTPSKMEAQNYAGKGKVYSKEVNLSDVAWIDAIEGQYAEIGNLEAEKEELAKDNVVEQPSSKLSKAQQEADDALQDFLDAFNDLNSENLGIVDNSAEKQAKMLIAGTKMVGAFTKLGVYKFADLINSIAQKGVQLTDELLSAIKKAYGAFSAENEIDELDEMKTVRAFKLSDVNNKEQTKTIKDEQQPRSTEVIESETEIIESTSKSVEDSAKNVGSDQQRAGEVKEQISEQIEKVESLLIEVDKKLSNLKLSDKKYSTLDVQSDYPNNVLAKGPIKKDATAFVKAVAAMTGLQHDTDRKGKTQIVNVNIAPVGGDVSFILWSKTNPEYGVYLSIPYENYQKDEDNYYAVAEKGSNPFMGSILWRVTTKKDKWIGLSNNYAESDVTAEEMAETLLTGLNRHFRSLGLQEETKPETKDIPDTEKKKKVNKKTSTKDANNQDNSLSLFGDNEQKTIENGRTEQQNSGTDNSGSESRRGELSPSEQLGGQGTSAKDSSGNSQSKRVRSEDSSSKPGNGPKYDVNKKYTNDEIHEIVSSITEIKDNKVVITGEVTDDIKTIASQYVSGGVAKKGRGVLDEYYTDSKIVESVLDLISKYFNPNNNIRVLEPSVGLGNFINAVPTDKSEVTSFEINETTARIAKIFHPDIEVNLRSFETEFIDDSGKKKPITNKYDLVLGNPPYGEHRGVYKGLGEESKISKYEDYFVKRSLDVLEENGILAMVLPSGWLNRHDRENGYKIERAYRLPSGAFEATGIGTDIVVLEKDSNYKATEDHSYFEKHPENVLGEIRERKNRFGRMEEYVDGDISNALDKIKEIEARRIANELEIDDNSDNINEIIEAVKETTKKESAKKIVKSTRGSKKSKAKQSKGDKIDITPSKLKYKFNKGDEIVEASLQFPNEFTKEEEEAFRDTDYSGKLKNYEKHKQLANYINGDWVHDFYYTEGNIYHKLELLELDRSNISQEQYDKQKKMLKSVLPKPKTIENINITPNTEFVSSLVITTDKAQEGKDNLRNLFLQFLSNLPREAFGNSNYWEVKDYSNNRQVFGSDKDRNQLVRKRRKIAGDNLFNKFLKEELGDKEQKQIEYAFNREYNAINKPDYSKVPMFSKINKTFKGSDLILASVQRAGVGRMTVKGVGVLAHEVGFGKTLSGVLSMHEAMTRNNAKKPLIVVPNDSILKQWVETIYDVIPQSTVNILGNLGVKYDLKDFAVDDGEITIVTYEGFKAMGFSDETYEALSQKFSYITDDLAKHKSERDKEIQKAKDEETKGKMKRGALYSFEDFGFDYLTFDEVHNANHIVGKVKLDKGEASDFRGQNQRTSDLGIKTWLASQYIQKQNNGRNVTLLSATPFTNKSLEYYSILSLVANSTLERMGFYRIDQFFETFMEADNDLEIKADGKPVQKTNVRRFKNNSLFNQLLSEFIDIKGEEDNPDLVRPDRHNKEYMINQNELTEQTISNIQELLSDNKTVLSGITQSRLVAFSPYASYMCESSPNDYKEFVTNSPKIKAAVKLIEQNKKDNPKASQLIYSEIGVDFFPMIRDYLVHESGFEPNEVMLITGATSVTERARIQNAFNKGEVKVVIGSPAIKEGLNLQENATDMYILSLPYNFTQLRQVEGRCWRQGNKWKNIRINYMLTEDTVDVFMLQRLQIKQGLYNEAMKNGADTVDVGDIDTEELKTVLITDPSTRAEIQIMIEKGRLETERTRINSDLAFVLRKFDSYNEIIKKIDNKRKDIKNYEKWAKESDYWKKSLEHERISLDQIEKDLNDERQKLAEKGVNVDDIKNQEKNSIDQIASIDKNIEELKDKYQVLVKKYKQENIDKISKRKDILDEYLNERREENANGFYTLRGEDKPKLKQADFLSIPDEMFSSIKSPEQAVEIVSNIIKELESKYDYLAETTTLPTKKAITEALLDTGADKSDVEDIKNDKSALYGVFYKGRIYINASAIRSSKDVATVWAHENFHAWMSNNNDLLLPLIDKFDTTDLNSFIPKNYWKMSNKEKIEEMLAYAVENVFIGKKLKNGPVQELIKPILTKYLDYATRGQFSERDSSVKWDAFTFGDNQGSGSESDGTSRKGGSTNQRQEADRNIQAGNSGVSGTRGVKLPETINVDGIERSTTNSDGNPIATSEQGVKNFWEWFGDSKVVDKDGRPLVVYHGTPEGGFNEFSETKRGARTGHDPEDVGFHFTDSKEYASSYSLEYRKDNYKNLIEYFGYIPEVSKAPEKATTYSVYLNIVSPKQLNDAKIYKSIIDNAKENSNDGIFASIGLVKEYVVFNPNQIKSVDNVGTFSESDNDIRFRAINKAEEFMKNPDDFKSLVGNYTMFLSDVLYNGLSDEARQSILDKAKSNGWITLNEDIEEYLSEVTDPEVLSYIKERLDADLTDGQLKYLLWRNFNKDDGTPIWKAKDVVKQQQLAGDTIFQNGDIPTGNQLAEYENRMKSTGFKFTQEVFDDLESLKVLQEIVTGKKMDDVSFNENAYKAFRLYRGRAREALDRYMKNIYVPMIQKLSSVNEKLDNTELKSIVSDLEGNKTNYTRATVYAMAKSGLSRMEWMARRDADNYKNEQMNNKKLLELDNEEYDEKVKEIEEKTERIYRKLRNKDVSGLTGLAQLVGRQNKNFKEVAQSIVDEVEKVLGEKEVNSLWEEIRKTNNWVIEKQYQGGKLTKEQFEKLKDMDPYYLPHRGYDMTTAGDVYDYRDMYDGNFQTVFKHAKGRMSLAEDPFAHIASMAASGILDAEKNRAKQKLYRMIATNPNNIVTINDLWVQNMGTEESPDWIEVYPDIKPDDTPEVVQSKLDSFNKKMLEIAGTGFAKKKANVLNLGMPVGKGNPDEHAIKISIGGKEKVMYINGNPTVAQAVNGLFSNKDNKEWNKFIKTVNRHLSSAYTSWNPEFGVSNGLRDAHAAVAFSFVENGWKYSADLLGNILAGMPTVANFIWRGKYAGKNADMLEEFYRNGGPNGYTLLKSIENYTDDIKTIHKQTKGSISGFNMFKVAGGYINNFNQMIELNTRFATYVTSRKYGKSEGESAYDAKNITLNFERHGAYQNAIMKYFANWVIFSNAAMQGIYRMYEAGSKNSARMAGVIGTHMAMGGLIPFITLAMLEMFGSDDDKEKYKNIPLWMKCNNLVVYSGNGRYLMYPLSHEFRWLYGLGVISAEAALGNLKGQNIGALMAEQMTSMLPIDGMSGPIGLAPSMTKPLLEVWANKNFMGRPIYKDTQWNKLDPEWTKVYGGTWKSYVEISKKMNEITGGDNVKKGAIESGDHARINNPAVIQHLTRGYFGGGIDVLGNFIDIVTNAASNIQNKESTNPSDIPFVRRVFRKATDSDADNALRKDMRSVEEFIREVEHLEKGYRDNMNDDTYREKFIELINSNDYVIYRNLKSQIKQLDKVKEINDVKKRRELEIPIQKQITDYFWENQ